jgi:hypothetical protein
MKKKILMIVAAIAILIGAGLTVEKTRDEAKIPVGGANTAYIPIGGTSADTVAYSDGGNVTVDSIPVGGT